MKDPSSKTAKGACSQTGAPKATRSWNNAEPTLIQFTASGKPGVLVQCAQAGEPEPTRAFGPFVEVPSDQVHPAGFGCRHCRGPVEVIRQAVGLVPRICVYSCACHKSVVVWEDERQPAGAKHWYRTIKFLKKVRRDVLICSGNRPTPPDFAGLN